MKKQALTVLATLFTSLLLAQTPKLELIWTTDTTLKVPESVLLDEGNKILYVSCIDGQSGDKDGKGSIAKVALDGKIINANWVSGLNAPKGMGLYKGKLYVADLTEVVVIDIKKGTIIEKIPVPESVFLNDISIDAKGTVYVTDSRTFKLHKIEKGTVFLLIDKLQGPNGLLAVKDGLLILDKGSLLKLSSSGQLSKIADGMDPSTDGIEMVKPREYIVSCWSGVIYYVHDNGQKTILLDSRNEKINTADIGYDVKKKIVYVPTFFKNSVMAYQINNN